MGVEMQSIAARAAKGLHLSVVVMAKGNDIRLVRLEGDDTHAAALALDSGFEYCGSISLEDGEPIVQCEPGETAHLVMVQAGAMFAEMLGPILQKRQLALLNAESESAEGLCEN